MLWLLVAASAARRERLPIRVYTSRTGLRMTSLPASFRTAPASSAGHRVGYQSPSQFSREYRRAFGMSSGADHRQLRLAGTAAMA